MNKYLRIALILIAACLIFMGFIGLFVPVLQGILFLAVGIYILTLVSDKFKAWVDRHLLRFPKFKHHYDTHTARVSSFFKGREGQK
ncbi:MAG TPA: hypothetical protein VGE35_01330 [Candidatus Paceibacterota bacterium]